MASSMVLGCHYSTVVEMLCQSQRSHAMFTDSAVLSFTESKAYLITVVIRIVAGTEKLFGYKNTNTDIPGCVLIPQLTRDLM